ncbi:MAG: DUF4188 domain-containing protein [Sumerlaeia bacterium]
MSPVRPARLTTTHTGPVVVLLIGMRINRKWKVWQWLPVFRAFWAMIRELKTGAPANGFLGYEPLLGPGGVMMTVQYWRSVEDLHAYAQDPQRLHSKGWAEFTRRVGTGGDVGVFHESYLSRGGDWEAIYINMPPFGLGGTGDLRECEGRRERARGRMDAGAGDVESCPGE